MTKSNKTTTQARTPVDMDISALLRSAQLLEKAANDLSAMEHDTQTSEEMEAALRHNRQIWSVFMGDARRPNSHLTAQIKEAVPALGSKVMTQTRISETEKTKQSLKELIDVNRTLASDLQRTKVA